MALEKIYKDSLGEAMSLTIALSEIWIIAYFQRDVSGDTHISQLILNVSDRINKLVNRTRKVDVFQDLLFQIFFNIFDVFSFKFHEEPSVLRDFFIPDTFLESCFVQDPNLSVE